MPRWTLVRQGSKALLGEAVEFSEPGGNPDTCHAVGVQNELVCDIGNSPTKHT